MTESEVLADCPTNYIFEVTNRDGTPLDANILFFDDVTQIISAESSDHAYIAQSPILLTMNVRYDDPKYTFAGSLDFELVIIDPCLNTAVVFTVP